jgi:hypothetical protein
MFETAGAGATSQIVSSSPCFAVFFIGLPAQTAGIAGKCLDYRRNTD